MKTITIALLLLLAAQCQVAQVTPPTHEPRAELISKALAAIKLDPGEINAAVMDSTFQIIGNKIEDTQLSITGTGFILCREIDSKHPRRQYALFTAAHVLSDCAKSGNSIKVRFRYRDDNDPLHWSLEDRLVKIFDGGRPLWVKHPSADVAVLPIEVPRGAIRTVLPIAILASKTTLSELYVGRAVYALGYPFGLLGLSGFPLLRPAQITSRVVYYREPFALAFQIFPGDSGGPVYSVERIGNSFEIFILGLLSQAQAVRSVSMPSKNGSEIFFVGVGYVVPSTQLLETINLLPAGKHAGSND